ncbi:MAG: adenine deaminase [Treponema sp.]|nr:adenine deaminase [Treponema sp.]
MKVYEGNIVDVVKREIFQGKVFVKDGRIKKIERCPVSAKEYILPGLINSHVHIESSMVTSQHFALEAMKHGVVAVVADPHEITNVCGKAGFEFMLKDAERSPMKIYFGVPSCVPATDFETSGARLDSAAVDELLGKEQVVCLAELMNFPGVLNGDKEVMAKIAAAKKHNKPIDGHAPMVRGDALKRYAAAGISTDHECEALDEALEKIKVGMKVQVREGSAAKDLDTLAPLFKTAPQSLMLCVDDLHPDDLAQGFIYKMVIRLLKAGYDFFDVMRAATLNPIKHYNLNVGLLQEGDPADFIVHGDIKKFSIREVVINGKSVVKNGRALFKVGKVKAINNFERKKIKAEDIAVRSDKARVRTIKVIDKELITESLFMDALLEDGFLKPNVKNDVLKIVCLNRYNLDSKPAVAFINGFALKKGAFASCVAHDSHNILCVGTDDDSIVKCVNKIISNKGGLSLYDGKKLFDIPLNVAGLMADIPCVKAAKKYSDLTKRARELGCSLAAPFMTLAFMALPVIPKLKITDKGLFDSEKMEFVKER